MNLKQWLILFCLPITQLWASSTEVKIGVLYGNTINEINAIQHKGNPKIFFDSLLFFRIDSTFNLKIVADLDSLTIFKKDSVNIGTSCYNF